MRLTEYTDYSLRVLIYLAVNRESVTTIQEIADTYGISKNHLVKVAHNLGRLGFVTTGRGRGGGIRLGREPETIRIGDLVRKVETDFKLAECFDVETNGCVISAECIYKTALTLAHAAFFNVLDEYTLADLVRNELALRKRFRIRAT